METASILTNVSATDEKPLRPLLTSDPKALRPFLHKDCAFVTQTIADRKGLDSDRDVLLPLTDGVFFSKADWEQMDKVMVAASRPRMQVCYEFFNRGLFVHDPFTEMGLLTKRGTTGFRCRLFSKKSERIAATLISLLWLPLWLQIELSG